MKLPDIEILKVLVKNAAQDILLKDFGCSSFEYKEDGSVITPADIAMQGRLQEELKQNWPMYDFLGEEMTEDNQNSVINSSDGYWCIDPLDGTSNYAAGIPLFAVSIALIIHGQQQLALVYDPVRDEMYSALKGQGATLNDQALDRSETKRSTAKPVIAEIDLKRLPQALAIKLVTESIFASQRNMGSSVLSWCWIAAGRFDVYLHGGQKMWDYAAGSLIFAEAGGHSISLDSEKIFRGRLETRSVLACFDENIFNHWCEWVGIPLQ